MKIPLAIASAAFALFSASHAVEASSLRLPSHGEKNTQTAGGLGESFEFEEQVLEGKAHAFDDSRFAGGIVASRPSLSESNNIQQCDGKSQATKQCIDVNVTGLFRIACDYGREACLEKETGCDTCGAEAESCWSFLFTCVACTKEFLDEVNCKLAADSCTGCSSEPDEDNGKGDSDRKGTNSASTNSTSNDDDKGTNSTGTKDEGTDDQGKDDEEPDGKGTDDQGEDDKESGGKGTEDDNDKDDKESEDKEPENKGTDDNGEDDKEEEGPNKVKPAASAAAMSAPRLFCLTIILIGWGLMQMI